MTLLQRIGGLVRENKDFILRSGVFAAGMTFNYLMNTTSILENSVEIGSMVDKYINLVGEYNAMLIPELIGGGGVIPIARYFDRANRRGETDVSSRDILSICGGLGATLAGLSCLVR